MSPRPTPETRLPHLDPAFGTAGALRLMTLLCTMEEGDYVTADRLQSLLGLEPEALQAEIGRLEEAGYVVTEHATHEKVTGTWVGTTRLGRATFRRYLDALGEHLRAGGTLAPLPLSLPA